MPMGTSGLCALSIRCRPAELEGAVGMGLVAPRSQSASLLLLLALVGLSLSHL